MFLTFIVKMKFMSILIFLTFLLGFGSSLSFSERKSQLIKILQTDVGHRSSYSYHRHHHHHHHHHSDHDSASVEENVIKKRLMLEALYARSNPRYYNEYPGMGSFINDVWLLGEIGSLSLCDNLLQKRFFG